MINNHSQHNWTEVLIPNIQINPFLPELFFHSFSGHNLR